MRERMGVSQRYLALLLKMGHMRIWAWESGRHKPTGFNRTVMELLEGALKKHSPEHVTECLYGTFGHKETVITTLVELNKPIEVKTT